MQPFFLNFQDTISRVKFPVESKSELGIRVRKKEKARKSDEQKNENVEMKVGFHILWVFRFISYFLDTKR